MSVCLPAKYKIGIVILAYNCIDITVKCLESLRTIKYNDYDIIVVDNNSRDDTAEAIPRDFPEVHFITLNENRGFTGGNNIGIQWCLERDYNAILLLNNDTVVTPDFLCYMAHHLENEMIVTPLILKINQPEHFGAWMGEFDWKRGVWKDDSSGKLATSLGDTPRVVGMASGCCLLIPRLVFERIGLFDENFFLYYEDIDLITRAKFAGYRIIYEPRAIVYHLGRASTDTKYLSPVALYYNVRNRIYIMNKFKKNSIKYSIFFTYYLANRMLKAIFWCKNGNWKLSLAEYRGVRDFLLRRMNRADYPW